MHASCREWLASCVAGIEIGTRSNMTVYNANALQPDALIEHVHAKGITAYVAVADSNKAPCKLPFLADVR